MIERKNLKFKEEGNLRVARSVMDFIRLNFVVVSNR